MLHDHQRGAYGESYHLTLFTLAAVIIVLIKGPNVGTWIDLQFRWLVVMTQTITVYSYYWYNG